MVNPSMANMQMLNFSNILNVKDSRWLQLEVCREFQRNKCTRPDTECKFAHPPVNVEVQNGRVTACYDSIKGRCNREKPPCKYFHPPQHLKDQLLINGRNHLALKNAFMTQIQGLSPGTQLVHGTLPVQQSSPYLTSIPTMANFNPYLTSSPVMTVGMTEAVGSPLTGVMQQAVVPAQKMPRPDRLEVCREFQRGACKRCESECRFAHPPDHVGTTDEGTVTVCMDAVKGRCARDPCRYFHPPPHLQAQLRVAQARPAHQPVAFHGMGVPYKRPVPDKTGMPVYQPTSNAAYQQALMQQLGGQSYVPVSCEYGGSTSTLLALPPSNADASTHSPPAAIASSTQLEIPSSSSATSSSSSTSTLSSSSFSFSTNTLSSSTSNKSNSLHIVNSSASPSLPATPMNVISYTGYSLNKGIRPLAKPSATQYVAPPTTIQGAIPSSYSSGGLPSSYSSGGLPSSYSSGLPSPYSSGLPSPYSSGGLPSPYSSGGLHSSYPSGVIPQSGISSMGIGLGMPPLGYGIQMPNGLTMVSPQGVASGIGGLVQGGMPMIQSMGGVGSGLSSMISPQLVYSQYPPTSVYLPSQLSALSNNQQISWAQAGEQPYKKLKTS